MTLEYLEYLFDGLTEDAKAELADFFWTVFSNTGMHR